MAKGTRLSQLSEIVHTLQRATTALKEEQSRQGALIEGVLQQLNKLALSYDSLVQITARNQSGGGTSSNVRVNVNPLFEGHGGIQARSLRLDFPRFDGGDPSEWILKEQQSSTLKTHQEQVMQHSST